MRPGSRSNIAGIGPSTGADRLPDDELQRRLKNAEDARLILTASGIRRELDRRAKAKEAGND